jgi:uncharacterized protein (DUF2267 family)
MEHDEFIGQLQSRARLASRGEAEVAARATLQTLSERISDGLFQNLVSQLPKGIGDYPPTDLDLRDTGDRFSYDEFLDRVAEREGVRKQDAAFHARCVLEVVDEATTGALMAKVREQLPTEFNALFAGSQGAAP